jgi:hypothetical protein
MRNLPIIVKDIVPEYLTRTSVEKAGCTACIALDLDAGKWALGSDSFSRADVLVAADQDEHERNDGKDGFGVQVWFYVPHSAFPVRGPVYGRRIISRD